jgi:hypothetical protein
VFQTIIVVIKCCSSIKRRINIDTLDFSSEFLFQRLESKEVIAKNQPIIEEIVFAGLVGGMIRLGRVLDQDARLQLWP